VRVRNLPNDKTPPKVKGVFISDDTPFVDTDPIATTTNVKVKIVAADEPSPSPAPTSGVSQYCIVRYRYNRALRFWEETNCQFKALPAPESGTTDTFIVDAELPPYAGVAYAFVWVKDGAGNISRTPGFDVISYIPSGEIEIDRNDVRIFRIPLAVGQNLTLSFTPQDGDVDVAVFDDFTNPAAQRIAVSANNGTVCEQVTLNATAGQPNKFQVEVRGVVNSSFTIAQAPCATTDVVASAATPEAAHDTPDTPLISGPPARAAIEDADTASSIFLPVISK
jgi:hypothetical protein